MLRYEWLHLGPAHARGLAGALFSAPVGVRTGLFILEKASEGEGAQTDAEVACGPRPLPSCFRMLSEAILKGQSSGRTLRILDVCAAPSIEVT